MGHDIEIRVLGEGNGQIATALGGGTQNWSTRGNFITPFEVYDLEADSVPVQINFCWWDRDENGLINAYAGSSYDRLILINTPYDPNGTHTPNSENATWYFSVYEDNGDLLINPSADDDQWTPGQTARLTFPNYISSKDTFMFKTPVKIESDNEQLLFKLFNNYPNPFNAETTIKYRLLKSMKVSIAIYNILGQKVKTLINREMDSGHHSVKWEGRNDHGEPVASGVYIVKMNTKDFIKTKKILYLK